MSVIRLASLSGLACEIKEAIPEFRDAAICLGQADPRKDLAFPSLNIDPIRWKYHPEQASEHHTPSADCLVVEVGRHEATIQFRLAAKTAGKRSELEQKIIDLFLRTELHPGILLTTISSCLDLGDFLAAWEFDEDEWEDAGAFDGSFYSVMAATGIIPALATREGVYTIEQLQMGLTSDFDTEFNPTTFNTSDKIEVVQVNEDGTIEAV